MAIITRDDTDRFFEHSVDMSSKTLYLGSITYDWDGGETGVDHAMAEYAVKGLHVLDKTKPEQPLTILMNNPGGDWYHGMGIFDAIKACSSHVVIKVFGHAMSMGSIILQAGDERILAPNSRFMIHFGYNGCDNHSKIMEKWADEGKRVNHCMENIYLDKMMAKDAADEEDRYLERVLKEIVDRQKELEYPKPAPVKYRFSTVPDKRREDVRVVLKSLLDYDTILTPEETIDLGLADEVMETH